MSMLKRKILFFLLLLIISIEKKIIMNLFAFSDRFKFPSSSFFFILHCNCRCSLFFFLCLYIVCVFFLFRFIHDRLSFRRQCHFQKYTRILTNINTAHTHTCIHIYINTNIIFIYSVFLDGILNENFHFFFAFYRICYAKILTQFSIIKNRLNLFVLINNQSIIIAFVFLLLFRSQ